jgi:hypothetical protein
VPWGVHESLLAFLAGFYLTLYAYKTPLSTRQFAVLFSHTEPLRSHSLLPSTNPFTGFQGTKGPHICPFWWPSGIFDPK